MKKFNFLAIILCLFIALSGCSGNVVGILENEKPFLFSNAKWDNNVNDLVSLHGDYSEKYDSMYGGLAYVFSDITFEGLNGVLRYFYNEENKLVLAQFHYKTNNKDDFTLASSTITEIISEKYGQGTAVTEEGTHTGTVWYRNEGNIGLMCASIDSPIVQVHQVQLSFLSKSISVEDNSSIVVNEDEHTELFNNETPLPERKCSYRYGVWGDDPKTIAKYEVYNGNEVIYADKNGNGIIYDGEDTILNTDTILIKDVNINGNTFNAGYLFSDEGFYGGVYRYTDTHSQAHSYISSYNSIKEELIEIYGTPFQDEKVIHDSNMANYINDDAKSLNYGYLSFYADWELDDTYIIIKLTSDNYEPILSIGYESKITEKNKDFGF